MLPKFKGKGISNVEFIFHTNCVNLGGSQKITSHVVFSGPSFWKMCFSESKDKKEDMRFRRQGMPHEKEATWLPSMTQKGRSLIVPVQIAPGAANAGWNQRTRGELEDGMHLAFRNKYENLKSDCLWDIDVEVGEGWGKWLLSVLISLTEIFHF